MSDEVLILVDEEAIDEYEGAIDGLKKSYAKWGLALDETYITMTFLGDLSVLENFTEFHMDYFDKNQILGKVFLFIIADSLDILLREEINKFPIFDYGYWQIYDIPAYILLIHKSSRIDNANTILEQYKKTEIFKSSYLLPKNVLKFISNEFEEDRRPSVEFTIFRSYPIGGVLSIDTWKDSFYKVY